MIEAFIGVDKFRPSKKNNWFTATPKKPHAISLNKSLASTFSRINILYKRKKRKKAPRTLNKMNPEGIINVGITSFAKL